MSKSPATKRKTGCHAEKTSSLSVNEREESIGFELKRCGLGSLSQPHPPDVGIYVNNLATEAADDADVHRTARVFSHVEQKSRAAELCYQRQPAYQQSDTTSPSGCVKHRTAAEPVRYELEGCFPK
ncbi:hypothetical protein E4U52_001789 [Claviceps spartinae]|nr:hypothetical protein E4U52_001789 [Claviceps spartinae]